MLISVEEGNEAPNTLISRFTVTNIINSADIFLVYSHYHLVHYLFSLISLLFRVCSLPHMMSKVTFSHWL